MNDEFESWIERFCDDGASTPMPGFPDRLGSEAGAVLAEWYRENGKSTEYGYLLDAALELLSDVLCDGRLTEASLGKLRRLRRTIRSAVRSERAAEPQSER